MNNPTIGYFLAQEQLAEFDRLGFIALSQQIPETLISHLDEASCMLVEALSQKAGDSLHNVLITQTQQQCYISRINDLYSYLYPEFLVLLGSPQLLDVARSLCGKDAIPIYESVMIRHLGDGTLTGLHQDMIHNRSSRIATFCIYLDEAAPGDGAVRVVPESQYQKHDLNRFDELSQTRRWHLHALTAQPGDLLIHDVMTIHDSPALTRRNRRRTLYFEFRSADYLQTCRQIPDEWLVKRLKLVEMAQDKYRAFSNGSSYALTPEQQAFFSSLYQTRFKMEPANYAIR